MSKKLKLSKTKKVRKNKKNMKKNTSGHFVKEKFLKKFKQMPIN